MNITLEQVIAETDILKLRQWHTAMCKETQTALFASCFRTVTRQDDREQWKRMQNAEAMSELIRERLVELGQNPWK